MEIELDNSLIIDFDNLPIDNGENFKYIDFLNERYGDSKRESLEQYNRLKGEFTYSSNKNINTTYYNFQKFMWLLGQVGVDIPWIRKSVVVYPESRKGEEGTYEGFKTIIPKLEYNIQLVLDPEKKSTSPAIINEEHWYIENTLQYLPEDCKKIISQHEYPSFGLPDSQERRYLPKRLYNVEVLYSETMKEFYLAILTPYGEMFFNTYVQ